MNYLPDLQSDKPVQINGEIARVAGHWLTGSTAAMRAAPHRFPAQIGRQNEGLARFRILHRWFVACSSVEAVRHVLVHRHENYPRSFHHRNGGLIIGTSLLTTEGEIWLTRRRQILPAFKNESLRHLSALAVEETRAMLDNWETLRRAGQPVIALEQAQLLTLSVISRALFSERIAPDDVRVFGRAVRESLRLIRARNLGLVVPPTWVPTPANRRLHAVRATLDEYIYRHLDARQSLAPAQWPDDILTLLKRARDPHDGASLNREALRDETKTLFVAGFETTSSTLAWCLYLLARDPAVAARWHEEVDAVLNGQAPDEGNIGRLSFTAAIVHEALRLYPPIYSMGRVALQDDVIGGKTVRRGDVLLVSIYGAHRDPAHWDEPDAFRPERFLPGQNWNRQAFLPFGAGKHQCLGNSFAHTEILTALAMIAQRYRIALPAGFEVGESAFITLSPRPRHPASTHAAPMIATLDLSRPDQLEDYERAFFAAFAPLTHNQLIRRLWHWDEAAGRLRTSVPYQEQLIFVRRDERGTIIAALAVGTRLQTVQSNYYGFEVPRGHRHCESLTFFNVGERRMRDTMSFWRFCRDELRARRVSAKFTRRRRRA